MNKLICMLLFGYPMVVFSQDVKMYMDGKWQSNKEMTVKSMYLAKMPEEKIKIIESRILGKLIHEYNNGKMVAYFPEEKNHQFVSYVLEKSGINKVTLYLKYPDYQDKVILNFEGNCYFLEVKHKWNYREYFCRLK